MHVIFEGSAGSGTGSGRSWAEVWSPEKASLSLVPQGALEHLLQCRSGPWAGLLQSCVDQPLATGLREGALRSPAGISGRAARGNPPGQGAGESSTASIWSVGALSLSSVGAAAGSIVSRKMVTLEGGSVVT